MQRTRSAAMLLMGMAVTAVSGCVAVGPATPPGPVPGRTAGGGAPDRGVMEPQVVQSPAKEALEAVGPPPGPAATARSSPGGHRAAPAPEAQAPAPRPERRRHRGPAEQRIPVPSVAPVPLTDVCALGEMYGRWPADSPQARICRGTYGD
ncbi:hypothetical protein [Streptomyces sp. NPDC051569]|uniref:hypothetical protein n=1 Tax=Streptomyces sp. NPDC051569 TaxID=3365661 RepID=UPI0037A23488